MKTQKIFGYELIMDLKDCDNAIISSKEKLQDYVDNLCILIGMKKFGDTILSHFGVSQAFTKGYSLVQLIETSCITGHFSELWNTAYINIFSCKDYDDEKAKNFTQSFFSAKRLKYKFIRR